MNFKKVSELATSIEDCDALALYRYLHYTYLAKNNVTYKDLCEYVGNTQLQQIFSNEKRRVL